MRALLRKRDIDIVSRLGKLEKDVREFMDSLHACETDTVESAESDLLVSSMIACSETRTIDSLNPDAAPFLPSCPLRLDELIQPGCCFEDFIPTADIAPFRSPIVEVDMESLVFTLHAGDIDAGDDHIADCADDDDDDVLDRLRLEESAAEDLERQNVCGPGLQHDEALMEIIHKEMVAPLFRILDETLDSISTIGTYFTS